MNNNKISNLIDFLERKFPKKLAYEGDNVGLQIGSLDADLKNSNILLALDVTNDVLDEAILNNVDLIIVHHPFIYKPINSLSFNKVISQKISKIIKNNISVYTLHTNLDFGYGGINDFLASALKLEKVVPMKKSGLDKDEYIYSNKSGIGRVGYLPKEEPLQSFIDNIKRTFDIENVRFIGKSANNINIKKVAISSGSGNDFIRLAHAHKADLYITGDITYHYAHEAKEMGLNILDIGHAVEKVCIDVLYDEINEYLNSEKINLNLIKSESTFEPYIFI